jgi:hypothetical protein
MHVIIYVNNNTNYDINIANNCKRVDVKYYTIIYLNQIK